MDLDYLLKYILGLYHCLGAMYSQAYIIYTFMKHFLATYCMKLTCRIVKNKIYLKIRVHPIA